MNTEAELTRILRMIVVVDEAGNVCEKGQEKPNGPDAQLAHVPVPVGNAGQQVSSTAFGQRPQRSSQPQLELETPKTIGDARVTATELRNALYHFIPSTGKIGREELLEKASTHLGLPLRKARSELNRIIAEEKRAGRLELDSGWENLWRA